MTRQWHRITDSERFKLFDSPTVSLTLDTEQVTFRSFCGGVKWKSSQLLLGNTQLLNINASLVSSVKPFKPHLPSSSSRPVPNSPIYTFKCKASVRQDPSPETTLEHFTSSIYCSITWGIWPTCWTIGIIFCMWWPTCRTHTCTVFQTEDWERLKLQPDCAGDLSLIFPLTQDFEIVYSRGRGSSFVEDTGFFLFLFYQEITKNIILTFTSCLDSAEITTGW